MPKLRAPEPVCARAAALARDIEAELHALGLWQDQPPVRALKCTFVERIEFELLPLLHSLAIGDVARPEQTSLGTRGVTELGRRPGAEHLEQLLFEVDRLIRGYRIEFARLAGLPIRGDALRSEAHRHDDTRPHDPTGTPRPRWASNF